MRHHRDYLPLYADNIVPIIPGRKAPGTLVNGGWYPLKGWTELGKVPRFLARAWDEMGAYVGLRCGPQGLLGFDVDSTDRSIAGAVMEALDAYFGVLPIRMVAHKDHVKFLALCRVPFHVRSLNTSFKQRDGKAAAIQLISHGRQFVSDGIHKDRNVPYFWSKHPTERLPPMVSEEAFDAFIADLPEVLASAGATEINADVRRATNIGKKGERCTLEKVKALLALIPNDKTWADYNQAWINMCFALVGATDGSDEGLELWLDWCAQQPQDMDYCYQKWFSVNPDNVATGCHELDRWARERNPMAVAKIDFMEDADEEVIAGYEEKFYSPGRAILEEYCVVTDKSLHFYNIKTVTNHNAEAFNAKMARHVPTLKLLYDSKTPSTIFSKVGVIADKVMRWPGQPPMFEDEFGAMIFNTWRPAPRPARTLPPNPEAVERYLAHARIVLGDEETVTAWMKWHAFMLQYPELSPGYHWLVISMQGQGKDLLLYPLVRAHTDRDAVDVKTHDFLREFNSHLAYRLCYVSELNLPKSDRIDSYTVLKDATSGSERSRINAKGQPEYTVVNNRGFVLFSNEARPMHMPKDDRRFYVVDSRHLPKETKSYYASFAALVREHWAEISEYFYNLKLSAEDLAEIRGSAPATEGKTALVVINEAPWVTELTLMLEQISAGRKFSPVATSTELRQWLKQVGIVTTQLDNDKLYDIGCRPLVAVKGYPKRAEKYKASGQRLWRLVDIWHDRKGVEYNLVDLSAAQLFNLWKAEDGVMPAADLKLVEDNDDLQAEE